MNPVLTKNKAPSGSQPKSVHELECEVSHLQRMVELWKHEAMWWQESSKTWHGHMMTLLGTMKAREEARAKARAATFNFGGN
jgi:hypothetical protein